MGILKDIYKAKDLFVKEHGVHPTAIRVCLVTFDRIKHELYPKPRFDLATIPLIKLDRMLILLDRSGFVGFEILESLKEKGL